MVAKNLIWIFIDHDAIKVKKEKIKQGREDFFFTSPILTTVSDVYNVLRLDNSASDPFR